jgi:hypothetical protein
VSRPGRDPRRGDLVDSSEFVSPPTVAAWLGIPVPALIAGAEQGLLPAIREGGRWRFHGPTVRAWMEADAAPEARRRLLEG